MSRKISIWISVLATLLCIGVPLQAATYTVDDDGPADFSTIQAAITVAIAGDTVYVFPGVYNEQVTMKDEVDLIGFGPHVTTIDGQNNYPQVVTFNGANGATFSGFRVTGSQTGVWWARSGVYVESGPLIIRNNIIEGNHGGIAVAAAGNPTIVNNTIVGNTNGIILGQRAEPLPAVDVAFIYDSDYPSAKSYAILLQDNGFSVDLIPLGDVAATDFSDYGVIIVGSDTSFGYNWGTPAAVNAVQNSGKPVLGLGYGGAGLFQEMGLSINWGNGWIGSEDSIYVVDLGHTIFNTPNPISIPGDRIIQLYTSTGHIGENEPYLSGGVILLGRESDDPNHYPLVQEGQHILWGFTGSPANMTADGQDLFINVVTYLHPLVPTPAATHTIVNNIIANNNSAGIFYYVYAAYDGDILYNDVWGNPTNYHNNQEGATTFVPQPGTGEISADPLFADSDYHLDEGSPCIDTGHPGVAYNDPDGTRNDMGAYGGPEAGGRGEWSGSGFIFTSVGDIPTAAIVQDDSNSSHGLADVNSTIATDFGIPQYTDSPFGGLLKIYGLFGDADTSVAYYQILAAKWDGDVPPAPEDYEPLNRALAKIKYIINPDFTVSYQNVSLGPKTIGGVDNLYQLTREGYWYHVDLRILWDTRLWENGKYTLTYKAFGYFQPWDFIYEISLPANTLDHLTLVVDNSPVTAEIHNVKYDPGSPYYDANDGEIPECGIINLGSDTENLRFTITAKHPNGYLRKYTLDMLYGKDRYGGVIATDSYTPASPPYWLGVENVEVQTDDAPGALVPWQQCAYQFRLRAWSRTTNGLQYLYRDEFNDHYFLDLGLSASCGGADLNNSGEVNWADFAIFAEHWLESCEL